ncbi:hypothetical protein JAO32_06485 [Terriglobus sp. ADX1]
MVNDVTREMTDPETGKSVWDRQKAATMTGRGRRSGGDGSGRKTIPFGPAGSGSDYAGFIDHLGVASINIGYGGEDRGGTYHSSYDTPWHWDQFADKDQVYGKLFAQTAGTIVLRIANADVMPYNFTELALTVKDYADNLKAEVKTMQAESTQRDRALKSGAFTLANDPKNSLTPPPALPMPPTYDWTTLDSAISKLSTASTRYEGLAAKAVALSPEKRKALNDGLAVSERKLLSDAGLPGRPWVKHLIYAPGTYTGYGASTLPGVREAIEAGRFDEAKQQLDVLVKSLNDEADFIDSLSSQIGQ